MTIKVDGRWMDGWMVNSRLTSGLQLLTYQIFKPDHTFHSYKHLQ